MYFFVIIPSEKYPMTCCVSHDYELAPGGHHRLVVTGSPSL